MAAGRVLEEDHDQIIKLIILVISRFVIGLDRLKHFMQISELFNTVYCRFQGDIFHVQNRDLCSIRTNVGI